MANARDIIPIVAAGLGGLIGGAPTARAVTNAAQISRQGRIDKQEQERRTQYMAQSARSLELSEEAAKRAEQGLGITRDRAAMSKEAHEERMKKYRESEANLKRFQDSWIKGNPDASDMHKELILSASTPYQANQAAAKIAEWTGGMTPQEAILASRELNLGPGEAVSYPIAGGGTHTARGIEQEGSEVRGGYGPITGEDLTQTSAQADIDWGDAKEKLRTQIASIRDKYQNAENGSALQGEYKQQIADLEKRLMREDTPEGRWSHHYTNLRKIKGLTSDNIRDLRGSFFAKVEQPEILDGRDPAVDAAYEALFGGGGEAPPLMPSHTARNVVAQPPITRRDTMIRGR